jgi:hypothetical protein
MDWKGSFFIRWEKVTVPVSWIVEKSVWLYKWLKKK